MRIVINCEVQERAHCAGLLECGSRLDPSRNADKSTAEPNFSVPHEYGLLDAVLIQVPGLDRTGAQ
jgi:hypothetical protein